VVVGSSEARLRLRRFARVLPQLLARSPLPLQRADLRYTNGFALEWAKPGIGNRESGMASATTTADSSRAMAVRMPALPIPHSPFPIPGSQT
jgi:cell division protein FtsQ